MTFFKLEISEIKNIYDNYIKYVTNLNDEYKIVYNTLIGVDSCWHDLNTASFINKVKKDRVSCIEYFEYLGKSYNEILKFCEDISRVCNKYNYSKVDRIKFDDSIVAECVNYIDQAIEILDINLNKLNLLIFDIKFASLSDVYNNVKDLKKVRSRLKDLKSDIENFTQEIKECIIDSKRRKRRIEKKELKLSLFEYNTKISNDMIFNNNSFDGSMESYTVNGPISRITKISGNKEVSFVNNSYNVSKNVVVGDSLIGKTSGGIINNKIDNSYTVKEQTKKNNSNLEFNKGLFSNFDTYNVVDKNNSVFPNISNVTSGNNYDISLENYNVQNIGVNVDNISNSSNIDVFKDN